MKPLIISVHVKTGARQDRMTLTGTNSFNIELKAQPQDGKANAALIKLLAKHLGVTQAAVNIKRGATSRNKLVEVTSLKHPAL